MPEDEGRNIFRNVGNCHRIPEDMNLHQHGYEEFIRLMSYSKLVVCY